MGDKYALIIAVEKYQDSHISEVTFAEEDAKGIVDALKLHGFSNIETCINADATKTIIEYKLKMATRSLNPEDLLIVYYAGHGFAENGHNYITCYDTQSGDYSGTSISLNSVTDNIRNSRCEHVILFLDSCHSGLDIDTSMRGIYDDLSENELSEFFDKSEYHIAFAACKTDEKSHPSSKLRHGIWTYHLLEALNGDSPIALNKNRYLTALSLQNYLCRIVPKTVRETYSDTRSQTPCIFGNISNDLLIADMKPIFELKQVNINQGIQQMTRSLFRGTVTGNIKLLKGFIPRLHKVYSEYSTSTRNFVANIAAEDIKVEAEEVFEELKVAFKYKRIETKIDISGNEATFICKDFDLRLLIEQNSEEPSEYIRLIEVYNIRTPEIVEDEVFNRVFKSKFDSIVFEYTGSVDIVKLIDSIEAIENDDISITYPSGYSSCEIRIKGLKASIKVDSGSLIIENISLCSPRELVGYLFQSQKLLFDTYKIKALPNL